MIKAKDRLFAWAADHIDHQAAADGPPPDRLRPFVRWCLRGSERTILIGTGLNALGGVIEVLMMVALGAVIDATVTGADGFFARHWGLLTLAALLVLVVRPVAFGLAGLVQSVAIGPNIFNLVLGRLHRHTLGQAISFFESDFAGRISQKQMQTARALTEVVVETVNAGSFAVSAVAATAVMAGGMHPALLGILMLWILCYVLFLRWFLPRIQQRATKAAAARAMVTGQVVDTITNIKTVKLFAQGAYEDQAALGAMGTLRDRKIDWANLSVLFRFFLIALAGALPVAMMGTALGLWHGGALSPGALTALGAMSIRLSQMTGWVSWTLLGVYGNLGEVEDGMHTLSPGHLLVDAPSATEVTDLTPEVRFEQVTFAYGGETGGIRAVDLTIKPGEKVGLVGASGAGKSTMMALLLRLYDAEQGRITIGGHDLRDMTQESLRRQIGLVTQETEMFNRSARDNIAYGCPDPSEEALLSATRRAAAHEFIQGLQDHEGRSGYDARLGERGVKLSGGQRQRIALARALLKDAPILVLDEATSALDSEVEAQIQSALHAAMEGKTVIAIAHRLSTLSDMDRIVVLDHGRIVEQGPHAALLAQGGLYARYWARQSGGFIGTDD